MSASREAIVACARSWLGTRFHHQGRLKKTTTHKGGVDCLGLLVGVAKESGLNRLVNGRAVALSSLDQTDYGHVPDGNYLRARLENIFTAISPRDAQPGDVLLFRFDHNPQHLAMISDHDDKEIYIIHAYAEARCVVEHRMDDMWKSRLASAFSIL